MKINFNCKEKKAKQSLIGKISEITGEKSKYMGPPEFRYSIGRYIIDKDGCLLAEQDSETELLLEKLIEAGFEAEIEETVVRSMASEAARVRDDFSLNIMLPRETLSDDGLERLKRTLEAKGSLIRKALDAASLEVVVEEERICFPWFARTVSPEETAAFSKFICALCKNANESKRASSVEKEVENEKYAFRCFLLRLGMIGDDTKEARKVLLSRLSGSAAFKSGQKKEGAA